jgi:phenylacetate-CoA ligase
MPDVSPQPGKRQQIRQLQMERLQMMLNRAYFNVDLYRRRMDETGLLPEDIRTPQDLQRFPFTTAEDLAEHYPYGLFAAPLKSIVRLKTTLNRRGDPIVIGYTKGDAGMWRDLTIRMLERLNVTEHDVVQVAFNYNLFPGAFTFNQATEALGAALAPAATLSATLQLQMMRDFRSTILITNPSFALHLADTAARPGGGPAGPRELRLVLVGPEPLPEAARSRLEEVLHVPVYALYGVMELVEPGLAAECSARDGLHLAEDRFLPEVINPANGSPMPPGREGELVLTSLTTEGYPLIRYRTGDVTVLKEAACSCGLAASRITPVMRRTDNRVSIRGIPFFPEQVEEILRRLDPGFDDFRLAIETRFGLGEQLEVLLARGSTKNLPGGSRARYLDLLRTHLRRALGFGARVQWVEPGRLPKEGLIRKTVFINRDQRDREEALPPL